MPFSFIEIEEEKSRVIAFVFLFIILFYFLTVYLILILAESFFIFHPADELRESLFILPSLEHTLVAFIIAFITGVFHWSISTNNLIEKMSLAVGALPFDPKDTYHQSFKNIVDEVSVAIGGQPIEAMVISSTGLNAFSLEDFNHRAIIVVTEGLLGRLNRSQIEAVVAHEAGHIVSGDCLSTTVTCSLSEIYEEFLSKLNVGLRESRDRGSVFLFLLFIILSAMNFLSGILRCFISRQREYRADAISVRLTRNPLSLAEALKLISRNWRGAGASGEKMESIFIVSPRFDSLDDEEGFIPDIFSTHPPIHKRIGILLDMAHLDEKTLEENLKHFQRVSPVAKPEFKIDEKASEVKKWFIFKERNWLGPFLLEDLKKLDGIRPDNWVKIEGEEAVIPAYEDEELKTALFTKDEEKEDALRCPHCKTVLDEISYEGAPLFKCTYCEGIFVEENKISRIFAREDMVFSEEIARLAEKLITSKDEWRLNDSAAKSSWVIPCPKCDNLMHRQFFVYSYPVEIDRCIFCLAIWFDKQELEILQYLYEHNTDIFDGKTF